uniref:Uncharacterized protein n=1 Tax=Fagus sylvatica TaxID=28930 RepID=A0A2N9GAN2_FAGSY
MAWVSAWRGVGVGLGLEELQHGSQPGLGFAPISAWGGCARRSRSQLGFLRRQSWLGVVEPCRFGSADWFVDRPGWGASVFHLCLSCVIYTHCFKPRLIHGGSHDGFWLLWVDSRWWWWWWRWVGRIWVMAVGVIRVIVADPRQTQTHGKNPSPPRAKSPRAGSPRSTHAHPEINPHPDRHRDKNPSPPTANRSPDRRRDQNPSPPSTQPPPENQQRRGESYGEHRRWESYGEQRKRTEKKRESTAERTEKNSSLGVAKHLASSPSPSTGY